MSRQDFAAHPGFARNQFRRLAVLTSGGDSPGMNAAVRAVVRTAVHRGVDVYAVYEGYKGLVAGGDAIRRMSFEDVGGILHLGGTSIGTARSEAFRTRAGRLRGAQNLVEREIAALIVIGGDGSLTGASLFRSEWPGLLDELVSTGAISPERAAAHPQLLLCGLVGSIDNDMFGTDMTIGADTALHRITEAMDALHSTAASHQRTFVIEVMGRHCGYLALMGALAAGANWVLIPEQPSQQGAWEDIMCAELRAGREAGRRQNLVVVAEGARDTAGDPVTADRVRTVLEERLGEDTRVTILGHVQRGGSPSAFDRNLATLLGSAAVDRLLRAAPDDEPQVLGIREHAMTASPLDEAVEKTRAVARLIEHQDYDGAMAMRGGSFADSWRTLQTMNRARPQPPPVGKRALRLAVLHSGGPAPGMNTAVRAAVRLAMNSGHVVLGVRNGFRGLVGGTLEELGWMSVTGWVGRGGAELGASRFQPDEASLDAIAASLAEHRIDGLLMIGGWSGYQAVRWLHAQRHRTPALDIPLVCLPASINNDLPGSELSIGADSALNSIVGDVDKIKQSAVASHRCFVVEVMGHECGYLALLGGLATGAERVSLSEEGISLSDLQSDVTYLMDGFRQGKRLGLVIRGEGAEPIYTTSFLHSLFEKEGGGLFDVRQAVLGHVQQGGAPSPFDRIQATRLAATCVDYLAEHAGSDSGGDHSAVIGLLSGRIRFTPVQQLPALTDPHARRPFDQWWLGLRPLAEMMARNRTV
jgi:6-phosphofructokinase 1